jgi:hypothetical protein
MLRRSRGAGTTERARSLSPDRARRAISRSPSRLSRTESEPARGAPLDDSGCPPRGVLVTPLAEVNRLRIEPMSPLGHLTLDEIHQVHHRNSRVRDRIAPVGSRRPHGVVTSAPTPDSSPSLHSRFLTHDTARRVAIPMLSQRCSGRPRCRQVQHFGSRRRPPAHRRPTFR